MASNEFPNGSVEEVLNLYGFVVSSLTSGKSDPRISQAIVALNAGLKVYGSQLDQHYKDKMDRYQVVIRNSCKDGSLDLVSRLQLLEIIELRAMKWKQNDNVANYYKHKLLQVEQCDVLYQHSGKGSNESPKSAGLNVSAPDFSPISNSNYLASATASLTSLLSLGSSNSDSGGNYGKVTMNSGKVERAFKPPGKPHQLKEEVVIRNSDSGKADPGAKERFVQIMGSDEEKIDNAKVLIRETIERNQTPDPGGIDQANKDEGAGGDAVRQYSFTIEVGDETSCLKVQGNNHELVKTAKLVLDDYFAKQLKSAEVNNNLAGGDSIKAETKKEKRIVYDRRALLSYSKSPFCREEPVAWSSQWESMVAENPGLLRNVKLSKVSEDSDEVAPEQMDYFKPTPEHFMHEVPRFPSGFVLSYQPFIPNNNNQNRNSRELSHLDKLFVKSSGGSISSRLNVDSYVVGVKYWDEFRGEWVTDGPETR